MTAPQSLICWRRGIFSWICPVYWVSIVLLRCEVEEIPALLAGEIPDTPTCTEILKWCDIPAGVSGRFIGTFSDVYKSIAIVWIRPSSGLPVLVHELMHVVTYVLNGRGVSLCDQSDEAYCYYIEWLLRTAIAELDPPTEQT